MAVVPQRKNAQRPQRAGGQRGERRLGRLSACHFAPYLSSGSSSTKSSVASKASLRSDLSGLGTEESKRIWAQRLITGSDSHDNLKHAQELLTQLIDEQLLLREAEEELRDAMLSDPSSDGSHPARAVLFDDDSEEGSDQGSPDSVDGHMTRTPYSRGGVAKHVYDSFDVAGPPSALFRSP